MMIKIKNKSCFICTCIIVIFYSFFFAYDGVVLCVDSNSYLNMEVSREPIYPILIYFLSCLFGKQLSLSILVLFQSLLLAFATNYLIYYLNRKINSNDIITYLICLIFLGISLLCRFVATRKSMYSNCILTEGITYPLFLLFFKFITEYVLEKKGKAMIIASVFSFLLISTRKQMVYTLVLLLMAIIYVCIKMKTIKNALINCTLVVLLVFGGSRLFDYGYMRMFHNITTTHTSDNRFITTMIFYTADKYDANLINDNEVKELFNSIYDVCYKNGYLKDKNINSWYKRVTNFSKNYDNIQIDTMWPMLREYAKNKSIDNPELLVDYYNNKIISSLLFKKMPEILLTLIDNFFAGLMITISADNELFMYYSIIMYILYIVLLIKNVKINKMNDVSLFSLLTLLSILINVLIISAVIFNQTRYTIYNMPLFYISLLLMIYNVLISKKNENKYEKNR